MNLIFIAPRFHTNHFFLTKRLVLNGHKVFYFVEKEIGISNNKYINPILINFSKFGLPIININNFNFNPKNSIVIIRDPFYFKSLKYLFYFRSYKKVFYSQVDASKQSIINKLIIKLYTNIFSAKWMTPVNSGDYNSNKKLIYFPFVSEFNIKPAKESNTKYFRFISIGKSQERKNLKLLIKAFLKIYEKNNKCRLKIITSYHDENGLKYFNNLNTLIKGNIKEAIDIYVNIPHEKSLSLLREADVFILPARNEIASISILEAYSANLPVILANDCGNAHYVEHLKTGYIFKTNELEDLIFGMNFFMSIGSRDFYKIKSNIFSYAKKNFDVSNVDKLIEKLN